MLALAHLFQLATAKSFCCAVCVWLVFGACGPKAHHCSPALRCLLLLISVSSSVYIGSFTPQLLQAAHVLSITRELETESDQPSEPKTYFSSTITDNRHFFLTVASIFVSKE